MSTKTNGRCDWAYESTLWVSAQESPRAITQICELGNKLRFVTNPETHVELSDLLDLNLAE